MLEIRDLHAGYVRDIDILRGLTLEAPTGRLTTVIGANGVGKSTLLKCVIGQVRPHAGHILCDGAEITGIATHWLVRRRIAYIAQRRNVFPHLSVRENLEMGAWSFRRDRARVHAALESALAAAPLLARFAGRAAGDLSGGQQRLLEIERALLCDPTLVLVDEPTVGLDPKTAAMIYRRLRQLSAEHGRTVLLVDQNIIAGTDIADQIYVIEMGATKLRADKAEFDVRYRDTIDEWLI
ncbi:MAG TPA: ATP-binding cassette domain-containing protein [Geminicoccaceae bacterium]|nr:ATP-binding cassette domain-containing protein [Geminicoccaceae bacterium]